MNLPSDVRALLDTLLPGMRAALGDHLVGVYLCGSLALGDFNPATSDVDFFAVTERRVSDSEFAALAALHERVARLPNRYARHIEGPYVDRAAAWRFVPGQRHPTFYSDEALRWSEHLANWTLDRWMVREHGVRLLGPDPKALIAPVSAEEVRDAVRRRLADWAAWVMAPDDPEWRLPRSESAYMVETMCRALFTLAHGELPSKPRAVAWALGALPKRWSAIVMLSQIWRADATLDPTLAPRVRAFVLWVAKRAADMSIVASEGSRSVDDSVHARVNAYLGQHAGDAQALLERLCRQPSIAAQRQGIGEMANLVESLLAETGFQTRRFMHSTNQDASPIVFGELHGASPYTLLLYDHYDVQPPEPFELWESPPFEPAVREGKLFARGTSDDKGEIAARLTAIRALRATLGELPFTLKYLIEGEEEIGSPNFEAIIAPHAKLLAADGCLWEGSGFTPSGRPQMVLGSKGLLYVQLDARGITRDAHSGGAPLLPSAAWRLVQALASLKTPNGRVRIAGFYDDALKPSAAQHEALVGEEDTEAQVKALYGISDFVDGLTGVAARERQAFSPTCNIAGIVSGYTGEGSKTVLPAHASAKIDFRLVPNQDPRDILAKLRAHLDAHGYADIQIATFASAEPLTTPLDDPFARRVIATAEDFSGQPASIAPSSGGTLPLLGALRRHVGVPGLSAPGDPVYWANGAHSPNEHIRLEDLDRAVRFNCHLFQHLAPVEGEPVPAKARATRKTR